jgi:hypothetical protein
MKEYTRIAKKSVLLLSLLIGGVTAAEAQSGKDIPAWIISKKVQRVANKQVFDNSDLRRSHIAANTTRPTWFISKPVHRSKDTTVRKGNVKSTGTPAWTISKPVHRNRMK